MRARMLARECVFSAAFLMALQVLGTRAAAAAPSAPERKTRIAIVGLDHDHVWGLLKYLEAEPDAELVAIAELQPARVKDGQVGAVQKIIVQYGHAGPKEIGVSEYFADWLYDPVKNGGGAIMDFGCYGAEWALWLKGRPKGVQAIAQKLKVSQHNKVDDDATILLEYPDATVIVEASWDWPHSMGQVQVFGPKGSLLATHDALFYRSTEDRGKSGLEGEPVALSGAQAATNNPVAYFVDCIRHDKPIEEPLSAQLNVQVLEILDAARESVRTGRVQELR